ncbi:MAG: serine protease, partial [Chitinophagaceae bacterium]
MKFKQVLFVVLISGLTTIAVLYGYNNLNKQPLTIQATNAQVPSNYVGLFDSNNNIPGQAVDFQDAALLTTPSVVHITTVIGKSQASNNLPRRSNPFADIFGDEFLKDFDNQMRTQPQRASGS